MGEQVGEPRPISPRRNSLRRMALVGAILAGSVLKPEDVGGEKIDFGTEFRSPPDPKLPPGKSSK